MPPGSSPVPPTELCNELATIWCDSKDECCGEPQTEDLMGCINRNTVACDAAVGRVLIDDAVGYDPVIAREVVEEGSGLAASCDLDIVEFLSSREGDPCHLDMECATLLHCQGGSVVTWGTCQLRLPNISACDRGPACDSYVCTDGRCLPRTQDRIYCAELFPEGDC